MFLSVLNKENILKYGIRNTINIIFKEEIDE
jgi:hypothetical protein